MTAMDPEFQGATSTDLPRQDSDQGFSLGFTKGFTTLNPRLNPPAREIPITSETCVLGLAAPTADPALSTCFEAGVGAVHSSPIVTNASLLQPARAGDQLWRRGFRLSERDWTILRLCLEQTFLTKEHVRFFFPDASERRIYARLQELCAAGFMKREQYPEFGTQTIYRVTDRGAEHARVNGARDVREPASLNPATLHHDALVTSCRLRLLNFWNAEFVPERAIKIREFPEIPDGIFFFRSGHGIAIEIENSDKGRTRFLRLLERWKETPSIVFILYVAATEKLFSALKRYLKDAPDDQPCGVVCWDELRAGHPMVHSPRGELDLLGRREF